MITVLWIFLHVMCILFNILFFHLYILYRCIKIRSTCNIYYLISVYKWNIVVIISWNFVISGVNYFKDSYPVHLHFPKCSRSRALFVPTRTYTRTYKYTYTCKYTYICKYTYTCKHTYTHTKSRRSIFTGIKI